MRGDLAVKPLSPCQLDVLAHHKVTTVRAELDGEERIYEQVLVTPKGLARLAELLERENAETSISGGSAR